MTESRGGVWLRAIRPPPREGDGDYSLGVLAGLPSALVWSPTGGRVAGVLADRSVQVWSAGNGESLGTVPGRMGDTAALESSLAGLAFNRREDRIAIRRREQLVVWDLERHREVWHASEQALLQDEAFSPDGRWLAVADRDGQVTVRDAETGELAKALRAGRARGDAAGVVRFSHDSSLLMIRGDELQVWRTGPWVIGRTMGRRIVAAEFSPTSEWVACVRYADWLELWSLSRGARILRREGAAQDDVVFAVDDRVLSVVNGRVIGWDRETGERTLDFPIPDSRDARISLSRNGRAVLALSPGGLLRAFQLDAPSGPQLVRERQDIARAVFSPSGDAMVTVSRRGVMRLLKVDDGDGRVTDGDPESLAPRADRVQFTPDGGALLSFAEDEICLWDPDHGRVIERWPRRVSPIGAWVVVGDRCSAIATVHGSTVVMRTSTVRHALALPDGSSTIERAGFSGDESLFFAVFLLRERTDPDASATLCDRGIRVWETASGQVVFEHVLPDAECLPWDKHHQVLPHSGDEYVTATDADGVFRVRTSRGQVLLERRSPAATSLDPCEMRPVHAVSVRDGEWVVARCATGEPVAHLHHALRDCVLQPGRRGRIIAGVTADGDVVLYEVRTGAGVEEHP